MKEVALTLFISILMNHELNIGYYVRKSLGIRISKPIKVLDCFPCFTWWLSIPIGLYYGDFYICIYSFLITKIYNIIEKRF